MKAVKNMNSINLTGNICNELEVKQTNSGKAVLTFNLAVKRPFTRDTTDFIPVVAFEQSAEYLGKYGRKGSRVAVSGKLTTRKWQDKDGKNRTEYEVIADNVELMNSKSDVGQASAPYIPDAYTAPSGYIPQSSVPTDTAQQQAMSFTPKPFAANETDDDLPF